MLETVAQRILTRSPWVILLSALAMMVAVAAIDLATGPEISVSIFYLFPVGLIAWTRGMGAASGIAFTSAVLWYAADRIARGAHANPLIPVWNASVRLGFFVVVAGLLTRQRRLFRLEQALARTDALTGVANLREFLRALETEIYRSGRYERPLSVAYVDLDDFKQVNDRLGHKAGDMLLRAIASVLAASIRESDVVGRLGGDEFALLMPETSGDAAEQVLRKLAHAVKEIRAGDDLAVTTSIGCISYSTPPESAEEAITDADSLMYEAKRAGKDKTLHIRR